MDIGREGNPPIDSKCKSGLEGCVGMMDPEALSLVEGSQVV